MIAEGVEQGGGCRHPFPEPEGLELFLGTRMNGPDEGLIGADFAQKEVDDGFQNLLFVYVGGSVHGHQSKS